MTLAVLFVCTGNVCRSPMAELLLRACVDEPGLAVSSAGMAALVGEPMDPPSAAAMAQLGLDGSAHRARQFDPREAARVDLVLTAERAHRDQVMTEVPAAFQRVFTLKEFARLARVVGPRPPREFIAAAAVARGVDGAVGLAVDNVPDPYRGGASQATSVARQVDAAVRAAIDALGLRPSATPPPRPPQQHAVRPA